MASVKFPYEDHARFVLHNTVANGLPFTSMATGWVNPAAIAEL